MKKIINLFRDYYLRKIRWRKYDLGKKFHAARGCSLWAKNQIKIGYNFYLGRYAQIHTDIIIGDYVMIGSHVAIIGKYDHHYKIPGKPMRLCPRIKDADYNWLGLNTPVIIEDDVWIGYGCIILSGVHIGQGSIVAAGSIVTKDVEPFSIYAGVPARKINNRFDSEEELKLHCELYKKSYQHDFDRGNKKVKILKKETVSIND